MFLKCWLFLFILVVFRIIFICFELLNESEIRFLVFICFGLILVSVNIVLEVVGFWREGELFMF